MFTETITSKEAGSNWETKYRVLTPTTLDVKNEEYTRFDKYKSKYMGRYNSVDQSKTDMSYADFGALVTAQEYSFKNGDILTGTVVQYDGPQKAMVEVGAKTAAVLPLREATISPLGDGETIATFVDVGEQYEFQIVSDSRDDGQVTVSIKKIMYAKAWEKLTEWYAEDPVFDAEIVQVTVRDRSDFDVRTGSSEINVVVIGILIIIPEAICPVKICRSGCYDPNIRLRWSIEPKSTKDHHRISELTSKCLPLLCAVSGA